MRKLTATLLGLCLVAASCGGDSEDEPTTAAAAVTTTATPTTMAATTTAPTTTTTTTTATTAPPATTTTTTTTLAPHPGVVGELLGSKPCALEVAPDATAWVTMSGSRDLVQINGAGETLDTISAGPGACGVAIAGGNIYIGDTSSNSVFWLDLDSGAFQDRLTLGGPPWDVQTLGDLVWIAVRRSGDVIALDPATQDVVFETDLGVSALAGLALSEGVTWVASESTDVVYRVDQETGEVTEIAVPGSPSWFAEGDGAVWVSQAANRSVTKIDTETAEAVLEVAVGGEPLDLAVGFGSVWVPNRADGTLTRIDEATGEVIDTYPLAKGIWVAEAVGDEIWVLDFSGTTIFRIDPTITR